jgi:hypothetical protein
MEWLSIGYAGYVYFRQDEKLYPYLGNASFGGIAVDMYRKYNKKNRCNDWK